MTTDGAAHADSIFRQAVLLHQQSRLDDARVLYESTLQVAPQHFHALHLLGVIALQTNQAKVAVDLIRKALVVDPSSVHALVNYGAAQHELRRFADAVASYERAIALNPDCAEAHFNRGNALRELDDQVAAVASYDTAIRLKPDYADAYLNRGLSLAALKRSEAALASYEKAMILQPARAEPYFNYANELRSAGRLDAAVTKYDAAIARQPGYAEAYLNRGSALIGLRRYEKALASYDAAIALRPSDADGHFNRGGALQYLERHADAVASYDTALTLRPHHAVTHANRAGALRALRKYEAAIEAFDRAVSLDADDAALLAVRRHTKMQICDWHQLDADIAKISAGVGRKSDPPNPFYLLALSDSAVLHRQAAENWVQEHCPPADRTDAFPPQRRKERIHVGYFSADFHEHATAYLIAELFELHDRSRFHITAFSFGPDSHTPMRRRIVAACDDFIEVRDRSDSDTVAIAKAKGIDIAVDLKGFTQDHRLGIFARRAAPVQVNYLGYPGTVGAPYLDYLIADRTLIPGDSQQHYAEKIIYLPNTYQVNDTHRAIAEKSFSRAELGLPATGFVFCCFNNTYKITPAVFHRWMRILARVENSVLWLLADNPAAVRNLRREATVRYVAPERLVFADRVDLPRHLARHAAADLFLDTVPCNAHTTASDALWAGLPVLTCPGESFASRVAASLVSAIGLPELIARTPEHYEELAIRLATQPQELNDIRRRLAENRLTAPLFDTPSYCRHLEAAYVHIHERFHANLAPESVDMSVHTGREAAVSVE